MKENTKKTSSKKSTTTNQVSRFAKARQQKQARKSKSSWTVVNEEFLTKDDINTIKSVKVIRASRSKDSEVLKARITYKDGDSEEFELRHHWEFQVGDELDKQTLSLCNLEDAEGNLKEYEGEVVEYLYGEPK